MGHIKEESIEKVKHSVNIVEIVNRYVPLKKTGQNFTGICPFHPDQKASFNVSPQRQIFKCFGCGKAGSVYTFVMEMDRVDFPTAVKMLANETGIEIEEIGRPTRKKETDALYTVLSEARALYYAFFKEGRAAQPARDYMLKRGFTEKHLMKHRIGYAPAAWDFLLERLERRYGAEVLEKASLITKKRSGEGHVDFYRNRILFPLQDIEGKVLGFGGRTLDPDEQIKYLNSREIPIFRKENYLYLLHIARRYARKEGHILVFEGYTDASMAHQHGLEHAIATAGTAFTNHHALALKKITDDVVLCYDPDSAGKESAIKAARLMMSADLNVSLILLPGKDPADVIAEEGDRFRSRIDSARPLFEFTLEDILSRHEIKTANDKNAILRELAPFLRLAPDAPACAVYVDEAAKKLDLCPNTVAEFINHYDKFDQQIDLKISPFPQRKYEYLVCCFLLRRPAYRNLFAWELSPEQFSDVTMRAFFSYFQRQKPMNGDINSDHELLSSPTSYDAEATKDLPKKIIEHAREKKIPVTESEVCRLVSTLQRTPAPPISAEKVAKRLLYSYYSFQLSELQDQLEDARLKKNQRALELLMPKQIELEHKLKESLR